MLRDLCGSHEWRVPIPPMARTTVGRDSLLSTLSPVGYLRILVPICDLNWKCMAEPKEGSYKRKEKTKFGKICLKVKTRV